MSRTSSTYVSPNLGPTAPWGQQTSTGVFRPPPAMTLNPGGDDAARHDGKSPPPCYPVGGAEAGNEHGLAPGPGHSVTSANSSAVHQRRSDAGSYAAAPSPPLQSTSPPFYPQNHYGNMPATLSLTSHNLTTAPSANGEDAGSTSGGVSTDRLMKMISYSVHREEDAFLAKKESNRVLERELQQEQEARRETQRHLDYLDEAFYLLQSIHDGQRQLAAQFGMQLE